MEACIILLLEGLVEINVFRTRGCSYNRSALRSKPSMDYIKLYLAAIPQRSLFTSSVLSRSALYIEDSTIGDKESKHMQGTKYDGITYVCRFYLAI